MTVKDKLEEGLGLLTLEKELTKTLKDKFKVKYVMNNEKHIFTGSSFYTVPV